ncbi:vacuolar protein sorting-associated protein 33A [Pelomyxa schiedti]|nr:vacuolar protein sorting-associated protein 33A [Pelomyxa schiedti]
MRSSGATASTAPSGGGRGRGSAAPSPSSSGGGARGGGPTGQQQPQQGQPQPQATSTASGGAQQQQQAQQQQAARPAVSLLSNAVVNLAALRERDRRRLAQILQVHHTFVTGQGIKALVLDQYLMGPLGYISEVAFLKANGVDKIWHLQQSIDFACSSVLYILRPKVALTKLLIRSLNNVMKTAKNVVCTVCFMPRRTYNCDLILEESGLSKFVSVTELGMDLIPIDDDLLSLELEDDYRECKLEGDRTSLFSVAKAIMKLQQLFGFIPQVKYKGNAAKEVCDMILRMRQELITEEEPLPPITPEIDTLILLDRDVDMVTPVLTTLTYEGFVDELHGIRNGFVELPVEVVSPPSTDKTTPAPPQPPPGTKVRYPLNNNDKLYQEIRNMNFSTVGPILNKKARDIDQYYKERRDNKTLNELRAYVKKIGVTQAEHNALRIYTYLAENILTETKKPLFSQQLTEEQSLIVGNDTENTFLENCIGRQEPLPKILRLLVLQSITLGGFKPKVYEFLKTEIVQTYGFSALYTLENLERLGLIHQQQGSKWPATISTPSVGGLSSVTFNTPSFAPPFMSAPPFATVRKLLRLVVEDVKLNPPSDIAYTFSGYAPVSVRLVEAALRPSGWREIEEALRALPGTQNELQQELQEGVQYEPPSSHSLSVSTPSEQKTRNNIVLVFYIGGLTYPELAALRHVSTSEANQCDIIVATTSLVNGSTLMSSLIERLPASPLATGVSPSSAPVVDDDLICPYSFGGGASASAGIGSTATAAQQPSYPTSPSTSPPLTTSAPGKGRTPPPSSSASSTSPGLSTSSSSSLSTSTSTAASKSSSVPSSSPPPAPTNPFESDSPSYHTSARSSSSSSSSASASSAASTNPFESNTTPTSTNPFDSDSPSTASTAFANLTNAPRAALGMGRTAVANLPNISVTGLFNKLGNKN